LAYHGIDFTHFRPPLPGDSSAATAATNPPCALRILSVGRFCEKKGFPFLLAACQQLQAAGIDVQCRIVGFGPLEAQLRSHIEALNLTTNVTLVGQLTQDQVLQQYHWADVFVLPCQVMADGDRDGIPNVLLEAMAAGVPVVSTAISGITELVQSAHNGLLVPEKDATAIAAALRQLAHDAALRQRLGQAGYQTVRQRFTLEHNVGQVKDWLLAALRTYAPAERPLSPSLSPHLEAAIQ
jgi:glycosyltransferase involved in cell wall biosynthesis